MFEELQEFVPQIHIPEGTSRSVCDKARDIQERCFDKAGEMQGRGINHMNHNRAEYALIGLTLATIAGLALATNGSTPATPDDQALIAVSKTIGIALAAVSAPLLAISSCFYYALCTGKDIPPYSMIRGRS